MEKRYTPSKQINAGYNDKKKIIEHYDLVSPYYRELWGEHLHHGYWETGSESKEDAQLALSAHLAEAAQIPRGAVVLDVGCGFGGSSLYLAREYHAVVTGITISETQARIARQNAQRAGMPARILVMDADDITLPDKFGVVWSVEAISHFRDKPAFFARVGELLEPGGTLALIDWFQQEDLSTAQQRTYIEPIERGMLVELKTISVYSNMIRAAGLDIGGTNDLSTHCAKTWDISLNLIKNRALWKLASDQGIDFVHFLRAFNAMRKGFASGNFVYGLIVARKK